ncbi:MAG: glycerophosphodiester phosphodiesterase [Bacillota bacterium]
MIILARPLVFAHRGYSAVAPENTLVAFRAAVDAGADGLELDVQLTADGEMVVIHDENLKRTTSGRGLVVQHTLAELRSLDAGAWFDPRFAGTQVPTLNEVLELIAPLNRLQLNIELKTGIIPYDGMEEKVVRAVVEHNLTERVIISSFNHYTLLRAKALSPRLPIGLLYAANLVDPWQYAATLGAEALHPYHHSISGEMVAASHRAGKRVNVWTVDQEVDLKRCAEYGVDCIITNQPERAREIITRMDNL